MSTRNIWFDMCDDEPALPIAPARIIPITDEIRRLDEAKQASRTVVITWKFRPSDPKQSAKTKAHNLSKDPLKQATPKRHRPCAGCETGTISRCNKNGLCLPCRKQKLADKYAEWLESKKKPVAAEPKKSMAGRKRNPPPTYEQLRERWRENAAKRYHDRRSGGLCGHCKEVIDTNKARCLKCLEKHRENNCRSYENRKKRISNAN